MGLDRAVVVERQLGPHEAVVELARLDLERLHVAGDLLLAPAVDDLERAVALAVGRAVDDHAQVGLDGDRDGRRRRGGELDAGEVDAGRGAGTWRRSMLSMNRAARMSMAARTYRDSRSVRGGLGQLPLRRWPIERGDDVDP